MRLNDMRAQLPPPLALRLPPLRGKGGKGGVAALEKSSISLRTYRLRRCALAGPRMRIIVRGRRATPHPAAAKLALLAKPPLPSPTRGEGRYFSMIEAIRSVFPLLLGAYLAGIARHTLASRAGAGSASRQRTDRCATPKLAAVGGNLRRRTSALRTQHGGSRRHD